MCNPTQKTHHDPNLGGIHYFPPYSIHCEQWWALCRNGKKSKKKWIKF
jgi:hypothetical protein